MRRREEFTFTEDEGPDGRSEPRFEYGDYSGRDWSDVAERSPELYFATRERLNPGREVRRFTAWVDQFYNIQQVLIRKTAVVTCPELPPWLPYAEADEAERQQAIAEERQARSQVTGRQERAESRGQWCFQHPDGTLAPERPEHPDYAHRTLIVVPWPPEPTVGPLPMGAAAETRDN